MPTPLRTLAMHAALALELHERTCRANGVALPDELKMCIGWAWQIAKGDSDRQEPTPLAFLAAMAEGRPVKPILLSIADAAAAIAVSERQIERLIASGDLASVKVGGSRRIHAADLEDFATNLRRPRSFAGAVEHKVVGHRDVGSSSSGAAMAANAPAGARDMTIPGSGGRTGGAAA